MVSRRKFSKHDREFVFNRAKNACEYCKIPQSFCPDSLELDHIYPISLGGENSTFNIALSCSGCNGRKYRITHRQDELTQTIVPLYNPRLQIWTEHFQWTNDFLVAKGITPSGRVTEKLLCINREGVVNIRKAIILLETISNL